MTEWEKRKRLMAELDGIIARLFSAAVDLAEQKIALREGKPLRPIRRALNHCAEEHKRYCGGEVRQAVKIIEPEPKLQKTKRSSRTLPPPPNVVKESAPEKRRGLKDWWPEAY